MGLTATIDKGLETAFKALGDLVTEGTLKKKQSSGFDFGSSVPDLATEVPLVIEVIEIESGKKTKVNEKSLLIKRKEVGDLSVYDILEYQGNSYTFSVEYGVNSFVTLIKAFKGVAL